MPRRAPLDGALALASAGEYVFPCQPNGKKPLVSDQENAATNDGEQLLRWASEFPGCNWGWAVGRTNKTAIDLDVKNEAENGVEWWRKHEEEIPETWTQKTPSGGYHLVFDGATRTTAGIIAPGVDTRSRGGYILAPGSVINGVAYTPNGQAYYATMPDWLKTAIGSPMPTDPLHNTCQTGWDSPENIERFEEYLRDLPAVPEGSRNNQCLRVALRARDMGVSEDACRDLMEECWLPKCDPGEFGFDATIRSAYRTAKLPAGNAAAEVMAEKFTGFDDIEPDEDPSEPRSNWVVSAASVPRLEIPKRQWVLGRRYMKGHVTVTIAPGGIGKSTLIILEALAINSGLPLTGQQIHKRGPVWIYSTEEPRDELLRRVHAAAMHHGITDLSTVYVSSGRDDPLILASNIDGQVRVNKPAVQRLIDKCVELGIVFLVIDPFVRTHNVNENDNAAIDKVSQALTRVASLAGVALSLVHHSSKAGRGAAGDMNAARGASSLVFAARIAHTLVNATEKEMKSLKGVSETDAGMVLRLDDAKANMSPPGANTTWFRRVSVDLGQGDSVGTLRLVESVPKEVELNRKELALRDAVFRAYPGEPTTCHKLATAIKRDENDSRRVDWISERIKVLFGGSGQVLDGKCLRLVRIKKGGVICDGIGEAENHVE